MVGGSGDDALLGGLNRDILIGGEDNDVLTGNPGDERNRIRSTDLRGQSRQHRNGDEQNNTDLDMSHEVPPSAS